MKTCPRTTFGTAVLIVGLALAAYCPTCRSQGTPFNGFDFGLPATIECEQFNRGGANLAYSTLDQYRSVIVSQSFGVPPLGGGAMEEARVPDMPRHRRLKPGLHTIVSLVGL